MKKSQLVFLSVLSGALLFAAWPVSPFTFLIFIAWLPLLLVTEQVKKKHIFFGHAFLVCLLWNTGTTWWMWNSTDVGAVAAIVAISLLMAIPWWGYHIFRHRYGKSIGYISLIAFWMLFEYINLNWQLSWPWLALGNVFASHPDWVQWYEYTGVSGGTLLILLVNAAFFEIYTAYRNKAFTKRTYPIVAGILLVPVLFFVTAWFHYKTPSAFAGNENVVIVQPNVDPYVKFETANAQKDIDNMVRLSEEQIDTATRLVLWPETAMSVKEWQNNIVSNHYYSTIFAMSGRHPQMTLLSGVESVKFYGRDKATATASQTGDGNYYDDFNSAITIRSGEPIRFYNKSKLVPGVESMPTFLGFMAPVFEKFGGTTGGYGRDPESSVFHITGSSYVAAPIICYESIYGEYIGSYVKKGATLLTIITNDGWWGNTPGHKQHLAYARLRAIETRRWVARSANTGISAVINEHGQILDSRGWDQQAVIKYSIPALTGETFYVHFGDYLFKFAGAIAFVLMVWHLIRSLRSRFNRSV